MRFLVTLNSISRLTIRSLDAIFDISQSRRTKILTITQTFNKILIVPNPFESFILKKS